MSVLTVQMNYIFQHKKMPGDDVNAVIRHLQVNTPFKNSLDTLVEMFRFQEFNTVFDFLS